MLGDNKKINDWLRTEENIEGGTKKMDGNKEIEVKKESPKEIVDFGKQSAELLKDIIETSQNKVMINGKQYLQFHDWQTIARFFGNNVGTEWSKEIKDTQGNLVGYEAKANVVNKEGHLVSSAEASCYNDEANWKNKPMFQLRSMAQTRACVKALRNVFSWVMVLAGYDPERTAERTNGDKNVKVENGRGDVVG